MLRYSVLRLLVFFSCLLILWLIGVRQPVWLLAATALSSTLISAVALKGPRDQLARQLEHRIKGRLANPDELAEDQAETQE